ncbi:MAG: 16S rRNA (adenine(1518)-N(6)/adenine(1519)-N(6))-dimethyltransferase RsmA [bacterium]
MNEANGTPNSQETGALLPADFFSNRGVQRLCQDAGMVPSKALGQNFLFQRSTLRAMVRDLGLEPGMAVVEVGCGFGHLTQTLLEAGYPVVAFETDSRLYESIVQHSCSRLEVVHSDIRSYDLTPWLEGPHSTAVVGNLPYSSAMSILFHLLTYYTKVSAWGFLLQREVGDRVKASPGSADYGRLSVMLQYLFHIRVLRKVGRGCFHPRPKVESAWLRFLPRQEADIELALSWMEPLVKAAFSHRRKKLSTNLTGASVGGICLTKKLVQDYLHKVGAESNHRAENLSSRQYASLASKIRQLSTESSPQIPN